MFGGSGAPGSGPIGNAQDGGGVVTHRRESSRPAVATSAVKVWPRITSTRGFYLFWEGLD